MLLKRFIRMGLPVLIVLLMIAGLFFHARITDQRTPCALEGVFDLTRWDEEDVIEIAGEWEFYWNQLLTGKEGNGETQAPMIVDAPGYWNDYRIDHTRLPGKGKATYRVHITGAKAGVPYGIRIQSMSTAYRLYIDGSLLMQRGAFGNTGTAYASAYRPQLAAFAPASESFDLALQIENSALGIGGMHEPLLLGTYDKVLAFDRMLSNAGASAMAALGVTCLLFLIFFAVERREKDMLILSGISILILLRFLTLGDVTLASLFPTLSIAAVNRIDFLTVPWTQFLLLYFVYYSYEGLVPRWQVTMLLAYSIGISLFILLFPFDTVTFAYMVMNIILLVVIASITAHLTRAAWQGREGASLLLCAIYLILLLIFYDLFLPDRSSEYYLLTNVRFEYMVFVFAQMAVVALRYRRAQTLEIAHLKGQIRPHFINNALTSIISISRTDPDRARELLVDFSAYLRGFYEYERDELVPFSQELELVRAYVALEQARFGDKLRTEYRIETEDFLLPPLMLQPLVENALVHGLRGKENGGTATVYTMRLKNAKVRVGVRDDGVGLHINPSGRKGIGVENINRRLSRLYRTSLIYLVPEGGGCEVYFEIPFQEASNHEGMAD